MKDVFQNSCSTVDVLNNLHLLIPSLHPFFLYTLQVAASTSVGTGPFSSPIVLRTDEDGKLYIRHPIPAELYPPLYHS